MSKNLITAWFILMLIIFARLNSYAESRTFYPTDDGYMYETGPGGNGLSEELRVGYSTTYGNYRDVIKFDLSVIPPGSTINSSYLTCHYYMSYVSNSNRNIRAHRVTANWNEGSITWNNNISSTVYDEQSVVGGYVKDYSWNVKSLVQYWVSGTYPNYGIMLKS